jgi:hypothetical protein
MLTNTVTHAKLGILLGFAVLLAFVVFGMPGLYAAAGFALGVIVTIEIYQIYSYCINGQYSFRVGVAMYLARKKLDTIVDIVVGLVCAALPVCVYLLL